MEKLVSILTPCYNGEYYIERFLNSVLVQSYKKLELIFVDDGSTDHTALVVNAFRDKFYMAGIKLVYIYQKNSGQASAINNGLKFVSGEYLIWPDSDDYLDIDSIKKRVHFLEENLKYGFVRSNAMYVDAVTLKNVKRLSALPRRFKSCLFDGFIKGNQFWVPGCYMLRMSAFLDVNPDKEIECSFVGQNIQMLLPVSYKYECGFIDEDLFFYVITPNSHSRVKRTYVQSIERNIEYHRLLGSVCNKIQMTVKDRDKYIKLINRDLFEFNTQIALKYNEKGEYVKFYSFRYKKNLLLIPLFFFLFYWKKAELFIVDKLKNIVKHIINQYGSKVSI